MLEYILYAVPLMLCCCVPSVAAAIPYYHCSLLSVVLLGMLSLRIVDTLMAAILGIRSPTEGASNLSVLTTVNLGFLALEAVSISFRSLSIGLRFSCNALAGHALGHIISNAMIVTPLSARAGAQAIYC